MPLFRKNKTGNGGLTPNRLEAFSDGVFAIAITILILGITVPHFEGHATDKEITRGVLMLWPKVLSYIISFLVIGIFWVGHHIMFRFIKRVDRNFLWLNILLLMTASFFPFPVELLGEYSFQTVSIMLYGSTLLIIGLIFYATWAYASHNHRLIDKTLPDHIIHLGKKVVIMGPVVYALALVLYFINPYITLAIYILVPIVYILPSPIDRLIEFEQNQ